MKSKFGTLRENDDGYYQVISNEKGHIWKLFHRVLFEEFYGEIPKGFVIHHKNGNKKDNCILNLQLMSDSAHKIHHSLGEHNPFYGKTHSDEIKLKISKTHKGVPHSQKQKDKISKSLSKTKNSTGYYRVSKTKNKKYATGVLWNYRYIKNGKRICLSSIHLDNLKEKVLANGLEWREF